MPKNQHISMSVIRRLPRYYRFLSELQSNGIIRISSRELAQKMGLTASQIRQDLNCFGGFGQQGYGYLVKYLYTEIGKILGLESKYGTILIGAGNLGRAVATHMSFEQRGFELGAIFDRSKRVVGHKINQMVVHHIDALPAYCEEHKPAVAVLCLPKNSVEELSETLYECGLRFFWNFSHYDLTMKYEDVIMENVHLSDSLMTLCYRITNQEEPQEN